MKHRAIGRFRSSSYFTGKASSSASSTPDQPLTRQDDGDDNDQEESNNEVGDEAILWIAGLGMAWVNTAIGFILPNTASAMGSASVLWMQVRLMILHFAMEGFFHQ